MREVEVKVIAIDRRKVEEKLKSLGAVKKFEGDVETAFFDFPGKPIAKAKNLLRLRKNGDENELTFKRFVANHSAKVRQEHEVRVSDFETTRHILLSIGLVEFQRMRKHRISYALKDGVTVDMDKYEGELSHIPDLMEIEAAGLATVRSYLKLLGLSQKDAKPWTTFDLVNYYSRSRAVV